MATALTTAQRDALKYQLLQITTGNGYNYTMHEVFDYPYDEFDMNNFPCGIMITSDDKILNTINGMNPQGMLVKNFDIIMDFYLDERNDIATAQDNLAADIEKKLMADNVRNWMPGSTGAKTCTQTMFFDSHKRFMVGEGLKVKPKWTCGLRVSLRIYYGQSITNPYLLM